MKTYLSISYTVPKLILKEILDSNGSFNFDGKEVCGSCLTTWFWFSRDLRDSFLQKLTSFCSQRPLNDLNNCCPRPDLSIIPHRSPLLQCIRFVFSKRTEEARETRCLTAVNNILHSTKELLYMTCWSPSFPSPTLICNQSDFCTSIEYGRRSIRT